MLCLKQRVQVRARFKDETGWDQRYNLSSLDSNNHSIDRGKENKHEYI